MDLKRLKEWMGSVEGLATTVATLAGMAGSLWAATTGALAELFAQLGWESLWWSRGGAAVVFALLGLILVRGFQRFSRASRLEQPDAFTLRPVDPATLIGRAEDLERLVRTVKRYRLVLLDGESGCGKSALVHAGLVPVLQHAGGLWPVPLREWGDDWLRGPVTETLEALFHAASVGERERLGWTAPDLVAPTALLADQLDAWLKAVARTLGRRPLLIADQFDDYQARHRQRFLDADGNWITPGALAAANPFWTAVSEGLAAGELHLIVVARADTALGLSCVRFSAAEPVAAQTLARVETDYLRPLLAGIAPDGASPPVVSHPEGGWQDLRERLERDLKAEGAILMQQVRTVILGLRQLPLLTPRHYQAAGGLRGVETLVVSRALLRAGAAAGGGEAGLRIAAATLSELVVPGGPDQPPKARRLGMARLEGIAGNRKVAMAVLEALQRDEVVRPADMASTDTAWQLDHDYLARAVLAETQRAHRWAQRLRDGKARYERAAEHWRQQYAELLPVDVLLRLCWERAWGRMRFGAAARYVQLSAMKPVTALLCLALFGTGAYAGYQDRLLTAEADRLLAQSRGAKATLATWRAPEPLRLRMYERLRAYPDRLDGAVQVNWHLAYAGLEPKRTREAVRLLSEQLVRRESGQEASILAQAYASLLPRLDNPAAVRAETAFLRGALERSAEGEGADHVLRAYVGMASQLGEPDTLYDAALFLRTQIERSQRRFGRSTLIEAYRMMASRLVHVKHVRTEAKAMRQLLAGMKDATAAGDIGAAYRAVAGRLIQADAKAEATALRALLQRDSRTPRAVPLLLAYTTVAGRLNGADARDEAIQWLHMDHGEYFFSRPDLFAQAYAAVATDAGESAVLLRTHMQNLLENMALNPPRQNMSPKEKIDGALDIASFELLVQAYMRLTAQLRDADQVSREAAALRSLIWREVAALNRFFSRRSTPGVVRTLLLAYSPIAARLAEATDVAAEAVGWRTRLQEDRAGYLNHDSDLTAVRKELLSTYTALAMRLSAPADVASEIAALAALQTRDETSYLFNELVEPYSALLIRRGDSAELKTLADALRAQMGDAPIGSPALPVYMRVAARLDDADAAEAATYLRRSWEHEADLEYGAPLLDAYAAVVAGAGSADELRAAAAYLRQQIGLSRYDFIADRLMSAYTTVAAGLIDPSDIRSAVRFLRMRLIHGGLNGDTKRMAALYAAMLAQSPDPAVPQAELAALQGEVERTRGAIVDELLRTYVALATRLHRPELLEALRVMLSTRLEQALVKADADSVGSAYADVARALMRGQTGDRGRAALVREILTLAGQPLLSAPNSLLATLTPASKTAFGSDLGKAVRWARSVYGIRPEQLRPWPLLSRDDPVDRRSAMAMAQ